MNMIICKRCGHTWEPRIKTAPAACPACKSYKWREATTTFKRPAVSLDVLDGLEAIDITTGAVRKDSDQVKDADLIYGDLPESA
jgi:DNA-directed RNA polymerase subunit RPC12/RpoP